MLDSPTALVDLARATQTEAVAQYVTLFGDQHDEVKRARRNLDKFTPVSNAPDATR